MDIICRSGNVNLQGVLFMLQAAPPCSEVGAVYKVQVLGTVGVGKKSLVAALLRHMGEGGALDVDDEAGVLSATPKQTANINNQTCRLECEDVYAEEEEDEGGETSALLPKQGINSKLTFSPSAPTAVCF